MQYRKLLMVAGAAALAGACARGGTSGGGATEPAGPGGSPTEVARADRDPTEAEVQFARETSDLMTNTVVAALLQEIKETTPENVPQGNLSIGLIFHDANRDMRLVGTMQPLSANDMPADDFERRALAAAMKNEPLTAVERVTGTWYYRRSNPLTNFQPQCAMCHANYTGLPATAPVGALMLRIPIATK